MKYMPLPSRDDDDTTRRPQFSQRGRLLLTHPLVSWILVVIFASLSLFLAMCLEAIHRGSEKMGSFADGYATDFVTARAHISVEQLTFTGSPSFDENGETFIPNPDPVKYIGDPIQYPEIDSNWDNLTWGRYILITKEEAVRTWGENIELYWDQQRGGYVVGLDMFHTLHCLNNLRKALNPGYYGHAHEHGGQKTRSASVDIFLHQDHCIEQLRQYIMCSGDMTPIPTKYYDSLGRNYVDSDVPHTCRNFEALQHWMIDRYEGASAVQPVL